MDLATPLNELRGVGPKLAVALQRLGLQNVRQLLQHYPFRYQDFSHIIPIARLQAGKPASVQAEVELVGSRRSFRRRLSITEAAIKDDTGYLKLVWFNQAYVAKSLENGVKIIVSGTPILAKDGSLQMTNPSVEPIKEEQTHTGRIVPIYPVTEGITPKYLRFLVQQALPAVKNIIDPLPQKIVRGEKLAPLQVAVQHIHFPASDADLMSARNRLAFDELLRFQLHNQIHRAQMHRATAPQITFHEEKTKDFVKKLPFTLTNGQRSAAWENIQSMTGPHPMNRLLQGDVGSGKTLVAVMAALNAIWSGHQVALMAPTEVLAEQHFHSIQKMLQNEAISIALLTGAQAKSHHPAPIKKDGLKKEIREGNAQLIIGTHALIVDNVRFHSLGLVIVDEQHRFGVAQRKLLKEKGDAALDKEPHFLSMTATPIPRTLALTLYSDLDISTITEMPKNRKPIRTHLIPESKRKEMYGFISRQMQQGRQAFVITALIDESDLLGVRAATNMAQELQKHVFPKYRIGLLHGKLGSKEKEKVMHGFANHRYDILVATSVIEVGIDVPNASVMVIENAERFGLAQLHQFRGRVGRGDAQSYCFLLSATEENSRLKKFAATQSGFAVAEEDLKRRGPGELRGGRQSGLPDFRMASLQDIELITRTRDIAKELLQQDPSLKKWPRLLASIRQDAVHWE